MNKHNPNSERHRRWLAIYQIVTEQPGINKFRVARMVGAPDRSVDALLCGMDNAGMLLAEDDVGRLWVADDLY